MRNIDIDGYLLAQKYNNRWYRRLAKKPIAFLHKIGLGWAYSRIICRLGMYTRYTDGRCQYCGKRVI